MWKCYNAVVRQLSSIAISKSPVRFSSCSRLYMLRHAHASVAAYCCWDSVSISASQLDKRWLLDIFFAEEDGIYFLQASVLDTECADIFLQFDTGALFKRGALVQHHEVVAQGKSYFVMPGFSSNMMIGRVKPVRFRRKRKQCSSDETCNKATLWDCPLVKDGRVSLSMPVWDIFSGRPQHCSAS